MWSSSEPGERQALDIDLSALQGEVVRLELRAGDAAARVREPRIVVTGETVTARPAQAKNVVLVLIDTLRSDKLRAVNPDTRVRTPGLDHFAKRAAVLTNARAQENWTKPSVATLLSSLMPWEHKAVTGDAVLPASVDTLPEILRERGFFTGAFIANGYVSGKFGFRQGWHTYRNYIREGRRSRAQYVAADVLRWLDERPEDKPFFLYVHTIDPHVPYKPPQHFLNMYDDKPYRGAVDFRRTNALLEKIKVGGVRLKQRDRQRLVALYDAEITYHDVHLASILQGLSQRGLDDDTIVVITSDHGEEFWEHGSVGHGHSVYDELLRVPMFVRLPGMTRAQRLDEAVGLVDIMPTIFDALGQPLERDAIAGRSLLPLLTERQLSAPPATVAGFMKGWRTLAVGDLKLIHRTVNRTKLFDTREDFFEAHDLSDTRPIAHAYARGLLGLTLAETSDTRTHQKRKRHRRQRTNIDPKTKAQLRALGYTGTSKP